MTHPDDAILIAALRDTIAEHRSTIERRDMVIEGLRERVADLEGEAAILRAELRQANAVHVEYPEVLNLLRSAETQ